MTDVLYEDLMEHVRIQFTLFLRGYYPFSMFISVQQMKFYFIFEISSLFLLIYHLHPSFKFTFYLHQS